MPKFGMKVPHLRCYSHTSFKVKRLQDVTRAGLQVKRSGLQMGGGIPCRPNLAATLLVCATMVLYEILNV